MTREKAIEILKRKTTIPNDDEDFDYISEAFDIAIKALEQELKTEKTFKMRNVTPEEREIINKHIGSISKPTGVNFWDLYKDPCEDAVSRQAVKEQMIKYGFHALDMTVTEFVQDLPPVNMAIQALEQEPCEDCISRKEALKMMDWGWKKGIYPSNKIAALPSVQPKHTECRDCISRQDAIKKVSEILKGVFVKYEDIAQKAIESLPSVTPQQKTGQWEYVQYDYNPKIGNWQCSECRCVVIECGDKKSKGDIPLYKYCPQCGCRIVEPQESEG